MVHSRTDKHETEDDVLEQGRAMAQRLAKGNTFFGMEFDNDTRAFVNGFYAAGISWAQGRYSAPLEQGAGKLLAPLLKNPSTMKTLGRIPLATKLMTPKGMAGAFFVLAQLAPFAQQTVKPLVEWRTERARLAKSCAPILHEMKQEGLPASIGSISAQDNEVIYAHRTRLNNDLSHISVSNVVTLAASQVAPIIHARTGIKVDNPASKHTNTPANTADAQGANGFLHMVPAGVSLITGKFTDKREKEHKEQQNSCSAFMLISNLDEQVKKMTQKGGKFEGASISYPRPMNNRSADLAGYIATTIKAHSQDMERLMPEDYSALRDALNTQLKEVSQALAKSMLAGDITPMALVRLLGEGHIIKQQGRSLVDKEELERTIGKQSQKTSNMPELSAADYFKMAAFKSKELKEVLDGMDEGSRLVFASFFPNSVLKEVGYSDQAITALRTDTAPLYEQKLSELLVALADKSDEELKKIGVASQEISTLRSAAKEIQAKGQEAAHSLRANAAKPSGIEITGMNAAIPLIKSGSIHLGTLLTKGKELLTKPAANDDEASMEPKEKRSRAAGHARRDHHSDRDHHSSHESRHESRHASDAADDIGRY